MDWKTATGAPKVLSRGLMGQDGSTLTIDQDLARTSRFLVWLAIIGFAAVGIWAVTRPTNAGLTAFAIGSLVLSGSGLVGGVLGLLFGIPKSVSETTANAANPPSSDDDDQAKPAMAARRSTYAVNTNLEQISDWLTKIIVGVGLTQMESLGSTFGSLSTNIGVSLVSSGVQSDPGAPVVAATIVVYGVTAGFLAGYLLTRIFLPGAFNRADALLEQYSELNTRLVEERATTEEAAKALGEIYTDLYRYEQEGFRDAIKKIDKLLVSPANRQNPTLWVYLAAANGQAYAWQLQHSEGAAPGREEALRKYRDDALAAVRTALSLGNDWKPVLRLMWDKEHPAKTSRHAAAENDLEVFYDDKDFRELLKD